MYTMNFMDQENLAGFCRYLVLGGEKKNQKGLLATSASMSAEIIPF